MTTITERHTPPPHNHTPHDYNEGAKALASLRGPALPYVVENSFLLWVLCLLELTGGSGRGCKVFLAIYRTVCTYPLGFGSYAGPGAVV